MSRRSRGAVSGKGDGEDRTLNTETPAANALFSFMTGCASTSVSGTEPNADKISPDGAMSFMFA